MLTAPSKLRRRLRLAVVGCACGLQASCSGHVPQVDEEVGKAHYQPHLAFRAQN
jgi:hypothetical protein